LILSQDQTLKLKLAPLDIAPCGTRRRANRLTQAPVELALGSNHPAAEAAGIVKCGQFAARRRLAATTTRRCPLILDGLCLHVLSSFQRTGLAVCPDLPRISASPEPDEF